MLSYMRIVIMRTKGTQNMTNTTYGRYYQDGYRAGHLDRLLGRFSIIASTYPEHNLPGYARGYLAGWYSR